MDKKKNNQIEYLVTCIGDFAEKYNLGKIQNLKNNKDNLEKFYNNLITQQQNSLFINNTSILHHLKMQIDICQKEIEYLKAEILKDENDIIKMIRGRMSKIKSIK